MDGKTYRNVGVSFRGNNSFTAVPEGLKRPLSLKIDFVHDQDLLGHRSLNLLNSNQDPTFLRSVLYLDVARDFNLYLDDKGRFLVTPHDANEGFRASGRGGGAAQPDPLTTLDDPNKALRHKLLVVPSPRDRYLKHVGDIAETWLDWQRLGPLVERYQKLIADDVARDTRKLDTTEAFMTGVYGPGDGAVPPATTIKGFADARRAALLAHPEIARVRQR